jgi:hypothetical protein
LLARLLFASDYRKMSKVTFSSDQAAPLEDRGGGGESRWLAMGEQSRLYADGTVAGVEAALRSTGAA